ncbi:DMT family transporter [uncultured Paludibaculum sp.]|uniref:DMT family transporter n=1 Tax=uncultured Paludibaculum sp. TaxID=1765020 RepID=UPI002AAB211D|nr:DMT family transporter [uncultured Paludibaculum sp.]
MRNFVLLALVNFLWAIQFPASRVAAQELRPLTLTWFAMLLAAILMLPVAWSERRPAAPPGRWPHRLAQVLVLGLSGSLIAQMCLNWGLERAPASNASVINLTVPVLMTVLAALLLGERMSSVRWLAFALSIPGVLLSSGIRWNETSFVEGRYFLGNMLIFLSCWGSAFYNVYSKRALDWLGPAQLLVATFTVSLIALLPAMLFYEPGPLQRLQSASSAALFGLIIIGALSLALSMFLYFRVLGEVDATQASLSIYFLPVFGVLLSGLALHETVSSALLAGGLLVGIGAWLVTMHEQRSKRTVTSS